MKRCSTWLLIMQAICISSFEKCLFSSSTCFLFFFFYAELHYLHRLDINPLLVISFTNIFSHSMSCLFVLLMVSFAVEKLFKFKQVLFVYFCFYFLFFRKQILKDSAKIMSYSVMLLFSSRSFIISSLIFRSSIHLEFIFVSGVRVCPNFVFLHVAIQMIFLFIY